MNREPRDLRNQDLRGRLQMYMHRQGWTNGCARIVPLTGDASDRRYFRVLRPQMPSIVLALHAAPFEWDSLPFANVAALLSRMPVPVPAILDHASDLGILALQDLGDVTLQAHLGAASPAEHAALYREAIALIGVLQRWGDDLASPEYLPYGIAFDIEKLSWELDFFVKHFMLAYRGAVIRAAEQQALAEEWLKVATELASDPPVLCHRDYHSRNLMLHEERLYVIDFQDARMGPDTYDLVSLLRDSYVDLTEEQVEDLLAYFLALKGAVGCSREFRLRFDLMALQRNLKALGTFGYQTTVRGNPVYIQYIPRTLHYVRTNLYQHARFGRLHELLAGHIDELA
jgi:N-acetylmuramate 1-kinase